MKFYYPSPWILTFSIFTLSEIWVWEDFLVLTHSDSDTFRFCRFFPNLTLSNLGFKYNSGTFSSFVYLCRLNYLNTYLMDLIYWLNLGQLALFQSQTHRSPVATNMKYNTSILILFAYWLVFLPKKWPRYVSINVHLFCCHLTDQASRNILLRWNYPAI